ncbi:periplasmic binding protein [Antarctobacter heliothermus]|uniref:Periplasmic binding protein n=1 Tax=Antarctobacter heliothermus TaxID=74033 RepID=A0A222E089_9RHOB|nr:ABC transporter substrate-binding protein [Antarctobacter heliothermus]ASP19624.1 periplasmic binding protein [Antarctobacter heliothermus]
MFLRTALTLCLSATVATADVSVEIHYLRQEIEQPPVLSNLDPIPADLGLRGAELAVTENTTTGRFLGQTYAMEVTTVPPGGDLTAAARSALAHTDLIVLDAPAEALLAVADLPEAANALIFNAAAPDDSLRGADCRANLLHSLPSNAMRTDALAQFLVKRRWDDLALIEGTHPDDIAFADALRTSLTKFGLRLRSEKTWAFDADMRRTASQEVPLFTQGLRDHDILLIADEIHDFGRYIAYNTWEPRPVAGSEGLVPVTWSDVVEQWGAAQLQSRFDKLAGRPMRSRDYAAWAAVRSIGEAVTRTNSGDTATLRAFLLGPDFELAGFKGRPMSYRNWNGQLRQPIPLVTDRALVAQAPLEGFLHQTSELDTLGQDRPDSACTAFLN